MIAYKPLLDAAIAMVDAQARPCVIFQRPGASRDWCRAATSTGTRRLPAPRRPTACLSTQPTRSTSSTRPEPRAGQGRRARQRGPRGRAELDDAAYLRRAARARSAGRLRTSAGSSATPTSCTRRFSHGCTTVLYEGKPVGTPDAGRSGGSIAEHGVTRSSRLRPPSARSSGGPRRGDCRRSTTCRSLRALFLAGERLDPDTYDWAQHHARRPGDRPLVADRDGLGHRAPTAGPRAAAG